MIRGSVYWLALFGMISIATHAVGIRYIFTFDSAEIEGGNPEQTAAFGSSFANFVQGSVISSSDIDLKRSDRIKLEKTPQTSADLAQEALKPVKKLQSIENLPSLRAEQIEVEQTSEISVIVNKENALPTKLGDKLQIFQTFQDHNAIKDIKRMPVKTNTDKTISNKASISTSISLNSVQTSTTVIAKAEIIVVPDIPDTALHHSIPISKASEALRQQSTPIQNSISKPKETLKTTPSGKVVTALLQKLPTIDFEKVLLIEPEVKSEQDAKTGSLTSSLRPKARPPASSVPKVNSRSGNAEESAVKGTDEGNKTSTGAGKKKTSPSKNSELGTTIESNYASSILQILKKQRRFKSQSIGRVRIRLSIAPDGSLSNIKILKSSGSARDDRTAIRQVKKAAPFPKPPKGAALSFEDILEWKEIYTTHKYIP